MSPAPTADAVPSSSGKNKRKTMKSSNKNDGDISNDVAKFAARLGFGGGGSFGDDSAFDDFDPAKAGRKIGDDGGKKKTTKKSKDVDGGGGIERRRAADAADANGSDATAPRTPTRPPKGKSARAAATAAEAAARSKERGSALNAALEAASYRGGDDRRGGGGWKRGGPAMAAARANAPSAPSPSAPSTAPAPKSIIDPEAPALWFDALEAAEEAAGVDSKGSGNDDDEKKNGDDDGNDLFARARASAASLLEAEAESSRAALARSRDADARWLSRARSEGTAADKVSAAALLAGDDPSGAGLAALDDLLKLASKKAGARAGAVAALDALSDLFCGPLLPPGRKLVPLAARPASLVRRVLRGAGEAATNEAPVGSTTAPPPNRDHRLACSRVLLYWGLEDALRRRAGDYLSLLESSSRDGLDVVKRASSRGASNLLKSRPEGEGRALALLVNKLGDPDRRSASDASHALMRVLDAHPAMAPVVAADAERAAFRPGQSARARYACVLFMSSLPFPRGGEAAGRMAERLVDAYFGLFRGVLDGRLSSSADDDDGGENKDSGSSKEARRKQKRKKIAKMRKMKGKGRGKGNKGGDDGGKEKESSVDAALRAGRVEGIDARLLGALLTGVRRAVPFLPSTGNAPPSEALAERHGPALYALASSAAPFAVGVQALALLFQLVEGGSGSGGDVGGGKGGKGDDGDDSTTTSSEVSDRFYRSLYARLSDPRAPKSARVGAFLSLVYRAARSDPSPRRACAFVKKLLQGAVAAPGASYAAACLLLVSELARERRSLWGLVSQPEEEGGEEEKRPKGKKAATSDSSDDAGDDDALVAPKTPPPTPSCWPLQGCGYDPTKREPLFCGASRSGLWELCPLSAHPHPSVAAFAKSLLAGEPISYDGDPLRDFSAAAVVDKIISKKPKKFSPRASAVGVGVGGVTAAWTATKAAAEAASGTSSRPDELFLRVLDDAKAETAGAKKKARKEERDKKRRKKRGNESSSEEEGEEEGDDDFEDDDDAIDAFLAGAEDAVGDEEGQKGSRRGASAFEAALAAALAEDAEMQEAAAAGGGGGRKKSSTAASKGGKNPSRKQEEGDSGPESEEGGGDESEEEGGSSSGGGDDDDDSGGDGKEEGSGGDDDDDEDDDEDDEEGTPDLDLPSASGSEELTTSASESGSDDDVEGNPWVMASGAEEALRGGKKKREREGQEEGEEEESDDDDFDDDDESDADDFDTDSASDSDSDGGDLPTFASADDFEDLLSRDEAGEDVSADAAARAGKKATKGKGKRARRG